MAHDWYYERDGKQCGPVPAKYLQQLASEGRLGPDDMVWRNGMANWIPASSLKGLFRAPQFEAAPESEATQYKDCPMCGERILVVAKKCKHCGEIIDVTLREANAARRVESPLGSVATNMVRLAVKTNWPLLIGGLIVTLISGGFAFWAINHLGANWGWLLAVVAIFAFIVARLRGFRCSFCKEVLTTWCFSQRKKCSKCGFVHVLDWK